MLYMNCFRMLRGQRKLHRCCCGLILAVPVSFALFSLVCSTFLKIVIIPELCKIYKQNQSIGAICEEFCSESSSFNNYNCIDGNPYEFSAERNGNVYEFHFVLPVNDGLSWQDKDGKDVYPKSADLYHMIKMHLLINYNVTLEESMLKRLINQEIDEHQPGQIQQFWWLFNDNNYMMTKLFEEEAILPTILGNCGAMYVTEQLDIPWRKKSHGQHKVLNFKALYEYVLRLDMIKPDPVKICKIELQHFGLTADARIKAVNANYMKLESQLHKELASGKSCLLDADCHWHVCEGICKQGMCIDAPRHDNVKVLCNFVQLFPEKFQYFLTKPRMRQFYEEKCKQKYILNFW